MNKIKKLYHKLMHFAKICVISIFYIFPINKKKVVLYNFAGAGYGDNPKYLAEELLKYKKYKLIWIVKNKNTEIPSEIKKVKYNSILSFYHMITAKLWIDTIRNNPKPPFKRKKQTYIQTWHGGLVLKGHEKDTEETLSADYIKVAKKDSKFADYMLSNCKMRTEIIKRAYWYDGKILEYGVPRDDILFNPNLNEIENFKAKYNAEGKKIVLYAPSFRNNKDFYSNIKFEPEKLVDTLNKKFGKEFVLFFSIHPNDRDKVKNISGFESIINLSDVQDTQLMLASCDVVISDYSSMLTDFTLTKRPAIMFAPDYDEYIKKERKLYVNLKEVGIPFAKSFDEIIEQIEKFENKKYLKVLDKLFEINGLFENGNSAKLIINHLIQKGEI